MVALNQWLVSIENRMKNGVSFDSVEDQINSEGTLNDDEKAALWLYAWSCQSGVEQRKLATDFAMRLALNQE